MNNDVMKLNIGCGTTKKHGYINVDWNFRDQPDVVHDLNIFPYPFVDNMFDLVEADHVLEHLDKPFQVMQEIHRILKPSGRVIIRVPHFSRGFTHAEHVHGFDVTFPLYFNKKTNVANFYGVEFELESLKLRWEPFANFLPFMGYGSVIVTMVKIVDSVLSWLANVSPTLCSRIWCFWVGGFNEIKFEFKKPALGIQ